MKTKYLFITKALLLFFIVTCNAAEANNFYKKNNFNLETISNKSSSIMVEYLEVSKSNTTFKELLKYDEAYTANTKITRYKNNRYEVTVNEIDRGNHTEVNAQLQYLGEGNNCLTLRLIFPLTGKNWKWFSGLEKSNIMLENSSYNDTKKIATILPPDGAFNTQNNTNGGYGDAIGQGKMSYYPLCAVNVDNIGESLGVDMTIPTVYRLSSEKNKGLIAEFDIATSPETEKFPNRAFFKLVRFNYDYKWGMRAALEKYYSIFKESFKKRVTNEGIWLPFTPLRSIKNWEDFGFAYHELSWNSMDDKDGKKLPTIASDKNTGVLSFQYTEPWDVQLPILQKNIAYDSLVSNKMIPKAHQEYIKNSATEDKNGLRQTRRLKTPWFSSGWAASTTTNSDPDLKGFNRYDYVKKTEITPALQMNVDGIYYDSMEWNWHHDLNYRTEHFKYTDYPLTFSKDVNRPAIWNFTSEFEFMKKTADEMHSQGKLAMGNGHGWNPFAAANLDLFGAELSWYSTGDHGAESLDFKRAISYQKPIVFLLNEGLNDKAFTDAPYEGYKIYFEKLLAYGFFPSFFSTDASSDPYWMDAQKIENGRPFFIKYIPIIKQISAAGWQPITHATSNSKAIRVERFGNAEELYFTIRNNGNKAVDCLLTIDLDELNITKKIKILELVKQQELKTKNSKVYINIPANNTQVLKIINK